jgi:hypothetical protein
VTGGLAQACICGCGKQFRRSRSMPICKAASDRAHALVKQIPPLDEPNAEFRRRNRFWADRSAVLAALRGDLGDAARRLAYQAEHGGRLAPVRA